jgi:hypothetical protein
MDVALELDLLLMQEHVFQVALGRWSATRDEKISDFRFEISELRLEQERFFPQNRPGRERRVDFAPGPPNCGGKEKTRGAPLRGCD